MGYIPLIYILQCYFIIHTYLVYSHWIYFWRCSVCSIPAAHTVHVRRNTVHRQRGCFDLLHGVVSTESPSLAPPPQVLPDVLPLCQPGLCRSDAAPHAQLETTLQVLPLVGSPGEGGGGESESRMKCLWFKVGLLDYGKKS